MKFLVYCSLLLLMFQYVLGQGDHAHDAAAGETKKGAFSCYQCDNVKDKDCGHGSDVNIRHIHPCVNGSAESDGMYLPPGEEFDLCRKIVSVVDFDVNSNKATERIKRTCGYEKSIYDKTCYYRAGLGGRSTVCTCTDSECNAGNYITPTIFGLCASSIFALLLKSLNYS